LRALKAPAGQHHAPASQVPSVGRRHVAVVAARTEVTVGPRPHRRVDVLGVALEEPISSATAMKPSGSSPS
jgi:hypothetical protein